MKLSQTELSYWESAIQGASSIGLMIVLFDTLAGDFRRAAAALRKNDIETRCRELSRAALVIGQLESWVDVEKGGESAQVLSRFYAYLRAKMMEAGVSKSAKVLDAQIDMILHVRSAWQKLDAAPPGAPAMPAESHTEQTTPSPSTRGTSVERIPFSQSG